MSKRTDNTVWWCERCHGSGLLVHDPKRPGVYDVLNALEDAHDGHVLANLLGCGFTTRTVHVAPAPAKPKESDR